jgi:hypothetical protein
MSATLLDGKKLAETMRAEIAAEAAAFTRRHGIALTGRRPRRRRSRQPGLQRKSALPVRRPALRPGCTICPKARRKPNSST